MDSKMKEVLIGGVCSILGGVVGAVGGSMINNTNTNSLAVSVNGEEVNVSSQEYEDVLAENKKISGENEDLNDRVKQLENEKDDSSASNEGNEDNQSLAKKKNLTELPIIDEYTSDFANRVTFKDFSGENQIDNYGDSHTSGVIFEGSVIGDVYRLYNLDGKYTKISGILRATSKVKNNQSTVKFQILDADDESNIIYETDVSASSDIEPIDCDITGIKRLKIRFQEIDYKGSGWCGFGFYDPILL